LIFLKGFSARPGVDSSSRAKRACWNTGSSGGSTPPPVEGFANENRLSRDAFDHLRLPDAKEHRFIRRIADGRGWPDADV
jgi:hypothetical protein